MRLYICIDGSFAGTQAEANAKGRGWTQVEVPTDKAGLIDYLNGMVDEARGACAQAVPKASPSPPPPPIMAATVTRDTQRQWDGESIIDFLLDRASVAQVENVFAAIGTRFAEARKAA
jgi:hypothetical protein